MGRLSCLCVTYLALVSYADMLESAMPPGGGGGGGGGGGTMFPTLSGCLLVYIICAQASFEWE